MAFSLSVSCQTILYVMPGGYVHTVRISAEEWQNVTKSSFSIIILSPQFISSSLASQIRQLCVSSKCSLHDTAVLFWIQNNRNLTVRVRHCNDLQRHLLVFKINTYLIFFRPLISTNLSVRLNQCSLIWSPGNVTVCSGEACTVVCRLCLGLPVFNIIRYRRILWVQGTHHIHTPWGEQNLPEPGQNGHQLWHLRSVLTVWCNLLPNSLLGGSNVIQPLNFFPPWNSYNTILHLFSLSVNTKITQVQVWTWILYI